MGVLPQGTFNYFARAHGIPTDAAQAVQALLQWHPVPVQLGLINEHVFLVNASLGLYPQLLQEREANKSRFGPGRLVALASALVTWLGPHRLLHLHIERGESVRDVKTAMLFIGNNRLQLDQVGWPQARALDQGYMAAVMLRPMGTLAMLWLLLRGSVGQLGDASAVESFTFHRLVVKPRLAWGHRGIKVAFDGEVCHMRAPLEFRISPKPLYLLKQTAQAPSSLDTQGCA
jgi:diacylglycerol kinase family enzyme